MVIERSLSWGRIGYTTECGAEFGFILRGSFILMYFLDTKSATSLLSFSSISLGSTDPSLDMYFYNKKVATFSQWLSS